MVTPSDDASRVHNWLKQIRASSLLKGGQRRYDLLDYLVQEELEGRGEHLKAYAIGLDVLGRSQNFDPTSDSIVRVEVGRLRDALELHYARSNDPSEPIISIPKGSYRPIIELPKTDESKTPKPQSKRKEIGSLAVIAALIICAGLLITGLQFLQRDQRPQSDLPIVEIAPIKTAPNSSSFSFARGFRQQLLTDIAHLPTVAVRDGSLANDHVRSTDIPAPEYFLNIVSAVEGQKGLIGLELISVKSSTVVWSRAIPVPETALDFYAQLSESVRGIGQEVAGPSGAITTEQASFALNTIEEHGSTNGEYQCLIVSLVFDSTKDPALRDVSKECLSESVENDTRNSTLLALFALTEFFESASIPTDQGGPSQQAIALLEDARSQALKAVQLNPSNAFAHEVLGNILSALGESDAAITRYQRAVDLAASRPAPHFLLGWQLALQGAWEDGIVKMQEGIDMQPVIPGYMIIPLAFDAFRRSDYERSLQYAREVIDRNDTRGYALAFAASLALGDEETAKQYFLNPDAGTPLDPSDPMRELRVTFSNPDVMSKYQTIIEPFLLELKKGFN